MKRSLNLWFPVVLIILGLAVFGFNGNTQSREIEYSSFINFVEEGRVESVVIERSNGQIFGELNNPSQVLGDTGKQVAIQNFTTTAIVTDALINELTDNGNIDVSFRNPPQWQAFAFSILPLVILLGYYAALLVLILFIVRYFSRRDERKSKS